MSKLSAKSTETEFLRAVPWPKVVAFAVALWGGLIVWQLQRGLSQLDLLADRVGSIDTRVAVLEERIPQPLSKELAPLTEEVRNLGLQFAELRGHLGGKPVAKNDVSD